MLTNVYDNCEITDANVRLVGMGVIRRLHSSCRCARFREEFKGEASTWFQQVEELKEHIGNAAGAPQLLLVEFILEYLVLFG